MGTIQRDELRIKATSEVFTPASLVQKKLNSLDQSLFTNPEITFCDKSCGDGAFLGEILIKKLENGIDFEKAISSIYGIDIMNDNVELCRERLLCGFNEYKNIVQRNIVNANTLTYHGKFDGSDPSKSKQDLHNETLFNFDI